MYIYVHTAHCIITYSLRVDHKFMGDRPSSLRKGEHQLGPWSGTLLIQLAKLPRTTPCQASPQLRPPSRFQKKAVFCQGFHKTFAKHINWCKWWHKFTNPFTGCARLWYYWKNRNQCVPGCRWPSFLSWHILFWTKVLAQTIHNIIICLRKLSPNL